MTTLRWILVVAALAGALFLGKTWLETHDETLELKGKLAVQQVIIDNAQQRIVARDKEVEVYRGTIEDLKRRTVTPKQVVAALPQVVQLPSPIFQTPELPDAPSQTVIPAESVKPLFDQLANCKISEHSLIACEETRKDLTAQVAAERQSKEDALKSLKGGSFLRRVKRNAKWMVIGAIVAIGTQQAVSRSRH